MPLPSHTETGVEDELNRAQRKALQRAAPRPQQRPALIAVNDAADYLGIARSTFYKVFIQDLETVQIGKRRLIVAESLDRLVAKLRGLAAE